MAYSYDRRKVAELSLSDRLFNFKKIVEYLEKGEDAIRDQDKAVGGVWSVQITLGALTRAAFSGAIRAGAYSLFLGLLQDYSLESKERKVVEQAAKLFSKRTLNRIPPEKAFDKFEKMLAEFRLFLGVAEKAIREGKTHEVGGETVLEVGPFKLINAGGFSAKVMADTAKVVEQAAKLLTRKGLGKVCYGSVHITNRVHKSTRNLAFYMPSSDEFYVRADLKGQSGPAVSSVIHELGHRLAHKFLSSKKDAIKTIYRRIKDQNDDLVRDKSNWPPVGTEFKAPEGTFQIIRYERKSGWVAVLQDTTDPKQTARIAVAGLLMRFGKMAFISRYASTDEDENFAEMIVAYCEDTLPDNQVAMLETVL